VRAKDAGKRCTRSPTRVARFLDEHKDVVEDIFDRVRDAVDQRWAAAWPS
jgi:hypothetical protein